MTMVVERDVGRGFLREIQCACLCQTLKSEKQRLIRKLFVEDQYYPDLKSVQFSHRYHSMLDVQWIVRSCYIVLLRMEKIQQTKTDQSLQ